MSKALIEQHISSLAVGKVPKVSPLHWDIRYEAHPSDIFSIEDDTKFRIEVRVGAHYIGPSHAAQELTRRGVRMVVNELYGEVHKETFKLLTMLWEEGCYRSDDDPIMVQLNKLLDMTAP